MCEPFWNTITYKQLYKKSKFCIFSSKPLGCKYCNCVLFFQFINTICKKKITKFQITFGFILLFILCICYYVIITTFPTLAFGWKVSHGHHLLAMWLTFSWTDKNKCLQDILVSVWGFLCLKNFSYKKP